MYEVSVKDHFSAAHSLKEIGGGCERVHGHNFKVEVFLKSNELLPDGTVIDFRKIKSYLKDVIDVLDHTNLNEFTGFSGANPSCEVIAKYVFEQLSDRLNSDTVRVSRVRVSESPNTGVTYSAD